MKQLREYFGKDRLDTKDNIYYLRLNMDDKYLVICDDKSIIVTKENKYYSVKINHVFDFDQDMFLEQIELLNNKKDVVGFRALPFGIRIAPGDQLDLNYDIVAKFNNEKYTLHLG